jgi:TPR repeat protein
MPNFNEAFKLFHKAAEQGHIDAMYYLASMYEKEQGIEKDYKEAAKWYEKAAEHGHLKAKEYLVTIYESAAIFFGDYGYKLAMMYEYGQGVSRNWEKAFKWYKSAALDRCADAQYKLGNLYEGGYRVKQDLKEAVKWYHRAAKLGHKSAAKAYRRLGWKVFFPFGS